MSLLEWNQIQAVADKLADQEEYIIHPGDLDEPWQTLYARVEPGTSLEDARAALWHAARGLPERRRLIETVLGALPARSRFPCLYELGGDLAPVDWLWPGWLPRGLLSLLGGAPGAGKSLLALDLARRVIHGLPWPDAASCADERPPAQDVVYVDAESTLQLLNQRALAWGLDRRRLYPLLPPTPYDLVDLGDAGQRDRFLGLLERVRPALVVLDSLGALNLRGENSVEDVRDLLNFLAATAREFDTGLLLVHHLRKQTNMVPRRRAITIDDFRGSSHIIAMARSVLALHPVQTTPEPARDAPRRLQIIKTNLTTPPPALGLRLEPGDARAPTLSYIDPPRPYRALTQTEACADWLVDYLAQASDAVAPRTVTQAAGRAGFGRATLYRARARLGSRIRETGRNSHDPTARWTLASGDEDDGETD